MSLKVILTESDIAMIVKDCTMSLLSESSEHILYHNTSVYTLAKMIRENRMFFSSATERQCQARIRGGAPNYMSLTRYKGDYEGYQSYNSCSVRLTIDNDRFQSVMRKGTVPMEAFSPNRWGYGGKSSKARYQELSKAIQDYNTMGGDWDDEDAKDEHFGSYYDGEHLMFPEEFVQGEESMNTDREYIDNPLRFITRIDVRYARNNQYGELVSLLKSHPDWARITRFHDSGLGVGD